MKATRHHFLLGFVLRASLVAATLPVILYGGEPRVIERGPHHKVWEQTATHRAADGKEFETRHSYVELASGLSYWDGAEWRDSREEISIVNGFAVAAAGQHKVIFAANLNSPGAIDMEAPDGKRFRSHIIGLSYTDSLSGDTVLIASIKDTVGAVASPNQVYYHAAGRIKLTHLRSNQTDPSLMGLF